MERILIEESGEMLTLTLNRANALNALDRKTFDELYKVLLEVEQRTDIKCVIVQGSGGNFSAGADVKEMHAMDTLNMQSFIQNGLIVMEKLSQLPQLVIAAIEGYTVGGGLELALACDFIVAGETVSLNMPESKLCLMPGAGGTQRLPERIGISRAKRMLFTGETIDGKRGLAMGLVDELAPPGTAYTQAFQMGKEIADGTTFESISGIKRAIGSLNPSLEGYRVERTMFFRCYKTDEGRQALKDFSEQHAKV